MWLAAWVTLSVLWVSPCCLLHILGASLFPEAVEAERDLASSLGHEGRCHTTTSAAATATMTKDVVLGCVSLSRDVAEATLH